MERNGRRTLLPSPSMAVALTALVVALGGTSYAVTQIDPRSVGSRELKRGAVARANIKNNAVNGSKIAADAIKGRDVDEGSLAKVPSAALADRAVAADAAGRANAAALLDRVVFRLAAGSAGPATGTPPESTPAAATAACGEPGLVAVGGGVRVSDGMSVNASYPDGPTAWTANVNNDNLVQSGFTVYVICVAAAAVG